MSLGILSKTKHPIRLKETQVIFDFTNCVEIQQQDSSIEFLKLRMWVCTLWKEHFAIFSIWNWRPATAVSLKGCLSDSKYNQFSEFCFLCSIDWIKIPTRIWVFWCFKNYSILPTSCLFVSASGILLLLLLQNAEIQIFWWASNLNPLMG